MNVALLECHLSLSSKEAESAIAHWFCISKLWKSLTGHSIAGALTMFDGKVSSIMYSLVADDESMWRRTIETSVESFKDAAN